ncbi:isocitrate lyase/PEP mutase family protein [Anatilimnocola floriformis]|uniref:isocitrate lyase/PEP mutase family protein n=1 Tax=Anatilimnocola floriformis TaxID=2948575 RepID=UPI0020C53D41|nr:isocitrate lyase/phosphoenolpyruvate mutase family protein [Anatilimnocola floriformis]
MNQHEKAAHFATLHARGNPVILFNAWDAGSAKAVAAAGAQAIATSSWAVAEAQGYRDGESIPFALLSQIVARITATTELPVTVDFEGGYSDNDETLAGHISQLLEMGIVGINFEDRVVQGKGLVSLERQSQRIAVIRAAADKRNVPLFINARSDVFFGEQGEAGGTVAAALQRAKSYAAAGASGLFLPGLKTESSIAEICTAAPLPINILMTDATPTSTTLAKLGVARISYGASPYVQQLAALQTAARTVYA